MGAPKAASTIPNSAQVKGSSARNSARVGAIRPAPTTVRISGAAQEAPTFDFAPAVPAAKAAREAVVQARRATRRITLAIGRVAPGPYPLCGKDEGATLEVGCSRV